MEIRDSIAKIWRPKASLEPLAPEEELIAVSSATRRIAYAYENFRNTLEPDEEDILRRKAIHRILVRRLPEELSPSIAAEQILQELIRAHYIEPVSKRFAERIATVFARTFAIWRHLDNPERAWFVHMAAVALDRELYPRHDEEALVQVMYEDTFRRAAWSDDLVAKEDRGVQLYVACHRALFEAEDFEIAHHYFRHQFPAWYADEFTEKDMSLLLQELPPFIKTMQLRLHHPARERLTRLLRPIAVPYRILRDIQENSPQPESPEALEQTVRDAVIDRTRKTRNRMSSRAWHSVLFLLFTKTIFAFLIEVPYEVILLREFHVPALILNITFHPILLLILATTVRMPGNRNTERIGDDLKKIVQNPHELSTILLHESRHYGTATWSIFAFIYMVLFLLIFWGLFTLLDSFGFSLVAMLMFIVFLGLVSFLAIRIRRSVNELQVIPRREGAIAAIVSFLSLPLLEFGRWLSQNISRYNVALFFMDRVLEAPFKILIDIVEEWFAFVRDRREEIA